MERATRRRILRRRARTANYRTRCRPVLPRGEEEVGRALAEGGDATISAAQEVGGDQPANRGLQDESRWWVRITQVGQ